jgi:hypothetical protein
VPADLGYKRALEREECRGGTMPMVVDMLGLTVHGRSD